MLLGRWYLLQQPDETGIWRGPALGLGWPGEVWVGEWPRVYGRRWQNPRLPPYSPPPRKEQIVPWRDWSGKSLSGFASLSRKQGQGTEQDTGGRAGGRLQAECGTFALAHLLPPASRITSSLVPSLPPGQETARFFSGEKEGPQGHEFQTLGTPTQGSGQKHKLRRLQKDEARKRLSLLLLETE